MSIPNREIGWSNESNLLWGIAKQMQQLNGILGNGGCCGGSASGCITLTDITWDALNAGNSAGTLADCYYNVTNRPASGTDPLYVLAEGGRVNLDNEVVRTQSSTGSLCVDSTEKGFGCFNVYAEQSIYTVDYVPGVKVIEMRLDAKLCSDINYNIGDTVTETEPSPGGATGTIVWTASANCTIYVQVTSGTFDSNGNITNGTTETKYSYGDKCTDESPLVVGTEVTGIPSDTSLEYPRGIITAISGTSITITPTSGSWDGIVVFAATLTGPSESVCFYTLTAPIVSTSVQLNSETVCWDAESYIGFNVYLNKLMQASDNLIYGTLGFAYDTPDCNVNGRKTTGQLFSFDPTTNSAKVLFEFDKPEEYGARPTCDVVEVGGELYGTCVEGGDYAAGTLWKWNIATKTFTKLYNFGGGGDGNNPYGGVVNVGGVLYGTCENGGNNGVGSLWRWEIATDAFTKLADFDDVDPILYPQGTLVEVNPGELWGTSFNGGDYGQGTIFKYTISSGVLSIVIDLHAVPNTGYGTVGGASGGVHLASDGNVYFNTVAGGYAEAGAICQITNVATTPTLYTLYELNGDSNGRSFDALCPVYVDGWLYGATNNVGNIGYGTFYKLNVSTGFFINLHDFNGPVDGAYPYFGQPLLIGNELFAMTNPVECVERPCTANCGEIFKYNIVTDEYTNIKALNSQAETSANIATSICNSITNPLYTCHTVGNCVYIDGPAGENGYTLALKTVVTYEWCYNPTISGECAPTVGDTLYNDSEGAVVGTIQTVTVTITEPEKVCGTMTVELVNNEYFPLVPFTYIVNETGCVGGIDNVTGTNLSYSVTPFAGGLEPVNLPCYYNVPFDVITEYPLSQKLTRKEIEYLVVNNLLIPGTYYRIIDVDFFLYGGTEIVIQAVAPDKFADMGMGKFYTPKYDQGIAGFGVYDKGDTYGVGDTAIWGGYVWTNISGSSGTDQSAYNLSYEDWGIPGRIKINISGISGTFNVDDRVYGYDSSYMGYITEVGTDFLIVQAPPSFFAYPTYDTSNIIYDDNTGAEATMDSVELHTEYFSDLVYDVRWDEIKYDYANDFITFRKDNAGNSVEQQLWEYDDWGATAYRAILGMQWGNEFDDNNYFGIGSNIVSGLTYIEIINFTGRAFINNIFTGGIFMSNGFLAGGPIFSYNTMTGDSIFTNNTFLSDTPFSKNYINSSTISGNNSYGIINGNTINYATFNGNALLASNCSISYNTIISGGSISYMTLNNTSQIIQNVVNEGSAVQNGFLLGSEISYCTFTNASYFDLTPSTFLSKTLRFLNCYASMNSNIGAATIIFGNYNKDLISRQDGTPRLRYLNNSDVQVITAVTT